MAEANDISTKRNLAIAWGVAALMLAAFVYSYFFGSVGSPGDKVTVSAKTVSLPEGFADAFKDFTGLLLVDSKGTITAITPKGDRIDLCEPGKPDCSPVMTAYALVDALSGVRSCGTCSVGGELNYCHKDLQKYPCHTDESHHSCRCR